MEMLHEITIRRSRKAPLPATVPRHIIRDLIRAAQLAPTCYNNQPARLVVVTGPDLPLIHPALSRGNSWARKAPVIIAVTSHPDLDCRIGDLDYYLLGMGLQLENLILEAVHHGLFAHPIAGFSEEKARLALGIPSNFRIPVLVIIGYPDPDEDLPDKGRKPMEEIAFEDQWGIPFRISCGNGDTGDVVMGAGSEGSE